MGRPLPAGLMCSGKEDEEKIVLGMPGPWAEVIWEASDHYTTKIGGLPDWPIPAEEINGDLLKCGVCGGGLGLVAQVYAPLATNRFEIEERTLYVFGCPIPNCGISPRSWRILRVQKDARVGESSQGVVNASSTLEASSVIMGDTTRIQLLDGASSEEQEHNSNDDEWWEDDTWRPMANGEDADGDGALDIHELGRALLEAGYLAAHQSEQEDGYIDPEIVENGAHMLDTSLPVLPCFYIYSQNESHPSRGSRAVSTLHSSVHLEGTEEGYVIGDVGDETWAGEEYEHSRALNVDRTYLKFKKRLDCYPEQCFRYCFGGRPLLANKDEGDPGLCELCGAPRVYEMQLMPPVLYYLQQAYKDSPSVCSPNHWEWLTLIVYTCSQSCDRGLGDSNHAHKEWLVVEEAIIIQYET